MQDNLVIYLQSGDVAAHTWIVVNQEGTVTQAGDHVHPHPHFLTEIALGKQVVVMVPAKDVLLLTASLPKMGKKQLLQALPYVLEDQLIDEVEALHIAIGPLSESNIPVAVVAHDKMQQWLTYLQSWKIQPDVLMPVLFALPCLEGEWHAVVNGMATVRTGQYQGFCCDPVNMNAMLASALAESNAIPQHIAIYYESPLPFLLDVPANIRVKQNHIESLLFLRDFAPQLAKPLGINLLQGRYESKKPIFPEFRFHWKIVPCLAIVWLMLLFFYPIVSYVMLQQRVNSLESDIAQIYQHHFPQSTSLVAPTSRMQEKWRRLTTGSRDYRLFILLGQIAKGMQMIESIRLKQLDFQDNVITLELTAPSSDTMMAFTDFLTQAGLTVEQKNVDLLDNEVRATLTIG